ncbi:MAG: polysaccharide biosynthesis protein [Lachnospiraceae bacterium]|jgi:FlaA1/EpsC-like NDP-sugar epimerase|nr:polysaccharide biosynthesis protein [Lachnospiraceae bacterium]MCH4064561.1 polysaccharide biosynthesis protein [Lachnospiraceae bacterium]MCH4104792.1 polysaccharide biosynthesis protein [Lachnospiraceae bacterium]MCI1308565.1 polysaccharide biosynthesis protein [Lachnospiraceae bacterium]MCI1357488.1 polysaccharide biosynthesis protein [Lachnospiraceae bacterium]
MEQKKSGIKYPLHGAVAVAFCDGILIAFSYWVGLLARYDFTFSSIARSAVRDHAIYVLFVVAASLIIYYIFGLYGNVWRYAGVVEVEQAVKAYIMLVPVLLGLWIVLPLEVSRAAIFVGYVLSFLFSCGIRLSYRFYCRKASEKKKNEEATENIMIIGAGAAGHQLAREFSTSTHLNGRVRCFIDDNPALIGKKMDGILVAGGRHTIAENAVRYDIDRICFAIPSASAKVRSEILDLCRATSAKVQVLPGMYQLVEGDVHVSQLRDVEVTDLLGRKEVKVNNDEIFRTLHGKCVLVTGGGGSIGSELCRQIAKAGPECLVIFDIYENNAYAIQQELRHLYPDLNLVTIIGSVRDYDRIFGVMNKYKPDCVFHAAAHKHVPLMEDSPNEAVKNNVFGTWNTARAAGETGVSMFLLISTDKAVNPTNVMGATKRICEMIVQDMNRRYANTRYVAVRFGNVLGSNGSVVPLFKKQIAAGGPVTVTDKNIIRYFMTIPEAVSLILQAAHYANGGEIFVLDMGDPVKIDDMARLLIRLSGHVPDVDIPIVYTGLRPGEKLYEELLMDEEGMTETENKRIFIGHPIDMNDAVFEKQLQGLKAEAEKNSPLIRQAIMGIVSTYHPANNSTPGTPTRVAAISRGPAGGIRRNRALTPGNAYMKKYEDQSSRAGGYHS